VRHTPETEALIQRFPLNCATAPLPVRPPGSNRAEAFNAWANAASVLGALGRNAEALAATEKGLAIFPDSPFLHWSRANLLFADGHLDASEQEYLVAIALNPMTAPGTHWRSRTLNEDGSPRRLTPRNTPPATP